jgi:hypothetical protein
MWHEAEKVSGAFELKLLVKSSCIESMHDITTSNKDLNSNVLSWTQRAMIIVSACLLKMCLLFVAACTIIRPAGGNREQWEERAMSRKQGVDFRVRRLGVVVRARTHGRASQIAGAELARHIVS